MSSILDLNHVQKELSSGGLVLALNTGAIITPEDEAMLQALHSRSSAGIKEHLRTLARAGSGKFMSSYYVGYNHKSIGDCGTGTIFIEGVSMLAAKAIQDWMLYSGQEASTRYIDFANQPFVCPSADQAVRNEGTDILERWRQFYINSQPVLREYLKYQFPRKEEEQKGAYDKAIAARSFDILRGFLPAGATTNLAWHSNLRQFGDHMTYLRQHPLVEVREVAEAVGTVLTEAYPNSFGHKLYPESEKYRQVWMEDDYYLDPSSELSKDQFPDFGLLFNGIDFDLLKAEYAGILQTRPAKTELPKQVGETGSMRIGFLIDFGSYRDIQRQRSIIQRMPLLTTKFGFEKWYFDSLPPRLQGQATELLEKQERALASIGLVPTKLQYLTAMGYRVPFRFSGDLPALVYIAELRASAMVHPTLHWRALQLADLLEEWFGSYGLKLYVDRELGRFDVKRGTQDIVQC